ncbi:pantothenate transporter [Mollisia scopiformis]|uniref:Pantothenate transporter n=1 Tax=Mollisia scopiformis TaxID=149040 RepID=A0A132BAR7_MOLSC|nr:pantothenate transporter [Mollisia scopiformis]KUJ09089.1 pantothenate transporter [Mollisia scopiformis]
MSSPNISEKIESSPNTTNEKTALETTQSLSISPNHPDSNLHFVTRGKVISDDDGSDETITGYDAGQMRARALLSIGQEKKLFRKIDWHLMPLMSLIYLLKNLDAANAANARIMDKGTDRNILTQLGMTSNDFNFVTTLYYIPYIIAEAPSNLLVKKVLPSRWQSRIMVTWGIALCCHAAVKNKEGLYTARFFLGLFEAGLWPGMLLQMCYWYRPDELARRILYVTVLGYFSTVIGGVLAFAFNGVTTGGLNGWQWLFLTEGIVTVVTGIVVFFALPDFPSGASWLSENEKAFIQARLPGNSPRSAEANFRFREILDVLKDKKIWLFTLCWAFFTIGTTGLTFYQPTVIANLGFTSIARSQLLNIPSAVVSVIVTIIFGLLSDAALVPQPLIPLSFLITLMACYAVLFTFPNTGGVYAATIIATGVSSSWYTVMWPWRVQTTERATGSAFAIAFVNSYGQIGGAVGSQIFNSKYAPHYATSFGVAMGMIGLAIVMNLVTWGFTYKIDNETRRLKRVRVLAGKTNETVLDDVDIHAGEKPRSESGSSA